MGKYDYILAKKGDIQYKLLYAQLANSNEANERNRLHRIDLAIKMLNLTNEDKVRVEAEIEEDLDLTDGTEEI